MPQATYTAADSTHGIQRNPFPWKALLYPLLALLLCITLTALFILLTFVHIELGLATSTTPDNVQYYYVLSKIAATLITTFIASEVQNMYLRRADMTLVGLGEGSPESSVEKVKKLDSYWRSVVKLPRFRDRLHHWQLSVTYLIVGLITTAFITRITPVTMSRHVQFKSEVPAATFDDCVSTNGPEPDYLTWVLNSTHYIESLGSEGCADRIARRLLPSVNVRDTDNWAYFDAGVAVLPGAIGAPSSIYASRTLDEVFAKYGKSMISIQQCAAVLMSNPVSCREIAAEYDGNKIKVDLADKNCLTTLDLQDEVPFDNVVPLISFCYGETVGSGALIVAAKGVAAGLLAAGMGLRRFDNDTSLYSVVCEVDTSKVFVERLLELSLRQSKNSHYSRTLKSLGPCPYPNDKTIGPMLLATAALSIFTLEEEQRSWITDFHDVLADQRNSLVLDGTFYAPRQVWGRWAFKESNNSLEDVLGILVGLATSRMGTYNRSELVSRIAYGEYAVTIVGSSGLYSLVLALPTFLVSITLIHLLLTDSRAQTEATSSSLEFLIRLK